MELSISPHPARGAGAAAKRPGTQAQGQNSRRAAGGGVAGGSGAGGVLGEKRAGGLRATDLSRAPGGARRLGEASEALS